MRFKIKYYKNMDLFCDGIIIYWLHEIHINKKWKNTPIVDLIIKHELTHLNFIKLINKYKKHRTFINFWKVFALIWINNIWDWFDCYKLMILKLLYENDVEIEVIKSRKKQ